MEIEAQYLSSFITKTKGLIGVKVVHPVLFQTRWGIHTIALQYAIDVVILDRKHKVVALKKSLKPNRVFLWNPVYDTVLELPKGTIDKKNISIGMHLTIRPK